MSAGQRPGGLTALAVINFVWSAFHALSVLGSVMWLVMPDEFRQKMIEDSGGQELTPDMAWIGLAVHAPITALLIVSGVGYLKQKRVIGRYVGNAYAILTLAGIAVGIAFESFQIQTAVFLVYPLLTLIVLNTIFREDLVR